MQRRFFVPHGTSFKIIGVLLGELGAEAADAAIQMAFHQRLKGREVAPLNGVDEVVMVGHHLGEPAGGQSVQHPEAAVVGVGVLQRPPEVHLTHGGEPRLVEPGVSLVETVEVQRFGLGQLVVGGGTLADEGAVLRCAVGRKVPQDRASTAMRS